MVCGGRFLGTFCGFLAGFGLGWVWDFQTRLESYTVWSGVAAEYHVAATACQEELLELHDSKACSARVCEHRP
jgi:hypothetical protein